MFNTDTIGAVGVRNDLPYLFVSLPFMLILSFALHPLPPSPLPPKIEGVTFGYDPANPLFSNVHFGVDLESRIGIVGPNGAGKSTLLNLILDKLRPLRGEVRRNANLRIAHFTQHAAEQFDYRLNSVDNMIKLFPGVQEQVGQRSLVMFALFLGICRSIA